MNKTSILLLSLLLFNIPANAENWVKLETGYYVDASSLTKYYLPNLGNVYYIWTKSYNDGSDIFTKKDDYFNVETLVDCDNYTYAVKSGKIYLKNGKVLPKSISKVANDNLEWLHVAPGVKGELLYNYVCQPGIKKTKETNTIKGSSEDKNLVASDIYKQNISSMLFITTQSMQGSGVIVKSDGTFVTCFHVIADADYIKVKTSEGKEYSVNGFKYINPLADVAVLTLDTSDKFSPIKFPDNNAEIGETVYTISNPQGFQFSFSDGMISQLSEKDIQFSAPISHGSSGGALLNKNGELIGIVTSFMGDSQNINFALPNNYYISKINNTSIKNINNQRWEDFVLNNASEEQYKLTIDYALNQNNLSLFYKYFRPYTELDDFPKDMYALMGYLAFFDYCYYGGGEEAIQDAIKWYKISLDNNLHEEVSSFALITLYAIEDPKLNASKIENLFPIVVKYPRNEQFMSEIQSCDTNDNKCKEGNITKLFSYLYNLTAEIYWNNDKEDE